MIRLAKWKRESRDNPSEECSKRIGSDLAAPSLSSLLTISPLASFSSARTPHVRRITWEQTYNLNQQQFATHSTGESRSVKLDFCG